MDAHVVICLYFSAAAVVATPVKLNAQITIFKFVRAKRLDSGI